MANNLAKLRRVGNRGGQFKRTIHQNTNPQRSTNLYKSVPGKLVKYDWVKIGQDIDGEAADDFSGDSVSMNASGTRVAVSSLNHDNQKGHVKVYEYKRNKWIQIGQELTGGTDGRGISDQFGVSVSMNAEGNRIAIGSNTADGPNDNVTNSGSVQVYEYKNNRWETLGQELHGEAQNDLSGVSVSMNAAGTRVAIGAIDHDNLKGHARVYQLEGGNWTKLGNDIDGEVAVDQSGWALSMNAAGTRVAIGERLNDGNTGIQNDNRGRVRVYKLENGNWTQLGTDIDGEAENDRSGYSVSMNAAGTRVAIGAPNHDNLKGHVRVYHLIGNVWTKLGTDIDGEAFEDESGTSVSMNAAGTRVAIGAPFNSAKGHVRIYEYRRVN